MTTAYPDNPYYNLFVFFLIKYRLTKLNFKNNLLLKLDIKAQQEISDILKRNQQLTLLEQHKPNFSDKKPVGPAEYYRLEKQNAELLHGMISFLLEKHGEVSPDFEYEIPTLLDLSARALSVYATKRGLFDDTRVDIDQKQHKIGILTKEQPWYSNPLFGKEYAKSPQKAPSEVFEKFMAIYKSKTTLEKIKENYKKLNKSYLIIDHFNFDETYINSIANFLLYGTINKDNNDFAKAIPTYNSEGNLINARSLAGLTALDIACELDAPKALAEELIISIYENNPPEKSKYTFQHIHRACIFDASEALVALLLKHGRKINETTNRVTPLHIACHFGHDKLALFLLQQGATMHAVVGSLWMPDYREEKYYYFHANALHLALMSGCKLATHYMIENNSDFSQVTKGKVHVLHLACQYGDRNIVKLLKEKIADCPVDEDNLNPADYALMNQNQAEKTAILETLKAFNILPAHSNKEVQKLLSNRNGKIEYASSSSTNDIKYFSVV